MSKEGEIKRILDSQMGSINSAAAYSRAYSAAERIVENQTKRDVAIMQTAQHSQEQVNLLKSQLREAKSQNDLLQTNYNTLNVLYEKVKEESESSKEEAIESRKATKRANRLSVIAMMLSSVLSVASIIVSILIALYLK